MSDRKIFALNDEFIFQLQNLVVYSMASGTHIVDNLRQLRLEESKDKLNTLVLTPEYLEYFEKMVGKLKEKAEKVAEEMATGLVDSEPAKN